MVFDNTEANIYVGGFSDPNYLIGKFSTSTLSHIWSQKPLSNPIYDNY